MRNPLGHIALAALATLALAVVAIAPAAAYEVKGTGFYGSFIGSGDDGQSMIVLDRSGGSKPRVHVTSVGLLPYIEQDNVYRSIACAGTPRAANRVFRTTGTANGAGELRYTRTLSSAIDFDRVNSIWRTVGDSTSCAPVEHFSRIATGDINGDGALGVWQQDPVSAIVALMEKRPNGRARLSIVIFGRGGDDVIRVRGSSAACGSSATASSIKFNDTFATSAATRIYDMNISELVSLRSMRITNLGTGKTWCEPLGIIAILIGL